MRFFVGALSTLSPIRKKKNLSLREKTQMSTDEAVTTQLYDIAKEWIDGHEKPGPANIITFATALMLAAQKLVGKGRGKFKKDLVLTIMARIVEDEVQFTTKADKLAVLGLLETLVPPAIDAIVGAGKELFSAENMSKCASCFGCK